MFWWKPSILIPDLYLHGIKIQTNIKQNLVEKYVEKSQIVKETTLFSNSKINIFDLVLGCFCNFVIKPLGKL